MFVSTEKRAWSINTLYKCKLRTGDMSIRFCCGISRLEFIVLGLEEQAITAQQLKNHRLAWRAKQWPLVGKTLFSSVPPSNSLVSVTDPRRAFWADKAPFSGPRLASCVASGTTEKQGHGLLCRARRWGPRTPSTTTDANLDCAFVENALF